LQVERTHGRKENNGLAVTPAAEPKPKNCIKPGIFKGGEQTQKGDPVRGGRDFIGKKQGGNWDRTQGGTAISNSARGKKETQKKPPGEGLAANGRQGVSINWCSHRLHRLTLLGGIGKND